MTGVANLGLTNLAAGQNQKEVTANANFERLASAISETFDANVTASNVTVTTAQYQAALAVRATNASVGGRTVTLPAVERIMVLHNDAANTQSVGFVRGSTTLTLLVGEAVLARTDGTANGLVALLRGVAGGYQPLDATLTAVAALAWTSGRLVPELTAADTFTLRPVGATNSTDLLDRAAGDGRFQPLDADLTAIAGLTSAADKGIQFTGSGTAGTFDLTAAGRALLDDASAAAQRTTLGLPASVTVLHNFTATTDPTAGDDSGVGYSEGSMWFNRTTGILYLCANPTPAAAVWIPYRAALSLPYRSGSWIGFGAVTALAATALAADTMYAVPIPIRWPVRIEQIAITIAAGVSGNARLGLFNNAVNGIAPTTRIIEADAPVSTTSTGNVAATITSQPMVYPPLVWAVMLPDAAAQPSAYPANGAHPGYASEIVGGTSGAFVSSNTAAGRAMRATAASAYSGGLPSSFGAPTFGAAGSAPMFALRAV